MAKLTSELNVLIYATGIATLLLGLNSLVSAYRVDHCGLRIDIGISIQTILVPSWIAFTIVIITQGASMASVLTPILLVDLGCLYLQTILNLGLLIASLTESDALCRKELGWVIYMIYWFLSILSTLAGVAVIMKMNRQEIYATVSGFYQASKTNELLISVYRQRCTLEGWKSIVYEADKLKPWLTRPQHLQAIEAAYRMYLIDEFSWKLNQRMAEELSKVADNSKDGSRWGTPRFKCRACQEGYRDGDLVFCIPPDDRVWHLDCAIKYIMVIECKTRNPSHLLSPEEEHQINMCPFPEPSSYARNEIKAKLSHPQLIKPYEQDSHPQNQKVGIAENVGKHLLEMISLKHHID